MSPIFVFGSLIVLGLVAFMNTIDYPFVHDDRVFILDNPRLTGGFQLHEIFFPVASDEPAFRQVNAYYRPVLEIYYRIVCSLFGKNPAAFHFFNVIIHVINGLLVYRMLGLITRRKGLSWLTAALFLVHPVQTEAVACVSGISNLLAGFFSLASLVCYFRVRQATEREGTKRLFFFMAFVFFLCGLMTKESTVILPGFIVFYEWFFHRRDFFRRPFSGWKSSGFFRAAGFFVIAGCYLLWRKFVLNSAVPAVFQHGYELGLRVLAVPATFLMDLRILVLPYDLHYYRSVDVLAPWPGSLIVFVILVYGVVAWVPFRRKDISFSLAWFVFFLFPVLNILPLIHEYSIIAAFEHFLYLPSAGIFLFLSILISEFIEKYWPGHARLILGMVSAGVLAACLLTTIPQNRVWRGEIPLFERAIRFEPNLGRIRILLGNAYYSRGLFPAAIEQYKKAFVIMEGYTKKVRDPGALDFYRHYLKEIHFNLGHCYEATGDFDAALRHYSEASRLDPFDSSLRNSLGVVYIYLGKDGAAGEQFQAAVQLDPDNLMALTNLAICRIKAGDPQAGKSLLEEALKTKPDFVPARQNLQILLLDKEFSSP